MKTMAIDAPASQTSVSELVSEVDLQNAAALDSTSLHAARMIGAALAGTRAYRSSRLGLGLRDC